MSETSLAEVANGKPASKNLSNVKPGDKIGFYGALSEDLEQRQKIQADFMNKAEEMGAVVNQCTLLCAYKQGYSWVEEDLLPAWKKIQN